MNMFWKLILIQNSILIPKICKPLIHLLTPKRNLTLKYYIFFIFRGRFIFLIFRRVFYHALIWQKRCFPNSRPIFSKLGPHEVKRGHLGSNEVTWAQMGSLGLKWGHLSSNEVTWAQMGSNEVTWAQSSSNEVTWAQMGSLGLNRAQTRSLGLK